MELTQEEQTFIQNETVTYFPEYLKAVWNVWPQLRYTQARRQASKLWKARKHWLKSLEPTQPVIGRVTHNCPSCVSSFHDIWSPVALDSNTTLTVTQWKDLMPNTCWGCREDQPNQLAHMEYGGCLYDQSLSMGLVDSYEYTPRILPPLPASPLSTD